MASVIHFTRGSVLIARYKARRQGKRWNAFKHPDAFGRLSLRVCGAETVVRIRPGDSMKIQEEDATRQGRVAGLKKIERLAVDRVGACQACADKLKLQFRNGAAG